MLNDRKRLAIGLVVLAIYLTGVVSIAFNQVVGSKLASVIATTTFDFVNEHIFVQKFPEVLNLDRRLPIQSNEEPIPEMDDVHFEVAEPLYGKDLYIFYVAQITEQYYPSVDPYIALAVLEIESNYNPKTKSMVGAIGLMQVIPKYHAWRVEKHCLNDLWDPYTNIICGIDFLDELYSKHGSWSKALYGYNASKTYVNVVLKRADKLRKDDYFG